MLTIHSPLLMVVHHTYIWLCIKTDALQFASVYNLEVIILKLCGRRLWHRARVLCHSIQSDKGGRRRYHVTAVLT